MRTYKKKVIADLIDAKLPWEEVKKIMSSPKDENRLEQFNAIQQEKVSWKDEIILSLGIHLFIVNNKKGKVVKCSCGHEFCDYKKNWKEYAHIYVRDTEEKLDEIFPGPTKCDPQWMVLREFYCPGCGAWHQSRDSDDVWLRCGRSSDRT